MTNPSYIGYIRVSNAEHDTSIPAQRERLEQYANQKGLNLVRFYEERKSAFKANNRKVFNQMIEHLKEENVSGVIFHKLDRSSRNPHEFATLESFFDTKDLRVIEGEFDTSSATGRLAFRMFCSLAIFYSENLSEEVTLKMKERLKLGYYPSNPPFGYRKGIKGKDDDFKKKYPDNNAPIVRKIFELYASGAYSYRSLAKDIRNRGIPMTKSRVETILNNSFYIGTLKWRSSKTGIVQVYEGNHEPIVSKRLWKAVQGLSKTRAKSRGQISRSPYSQFIKCECGSYLYFSTSNNGKGKEYTYASCRNKDCSVKNVREEIIEKQICSYINNFQLRIDAVKGILKVQEIESGNESTQAQIDHLESEIDKMHKRMKLVQEAYLDQILTKEEAQNRTNQIREKMEDMNTDRRELMEKTYSKKLLEYTDIVKSFRTIEKAYPIAKDATKAKILRLLFTNPHLKGKKLTLEPNSEVLGISLCRYLQNGRLLPSHSERIRRAINDLCHNQRFAMIWNQINEEIS